MSNQLGPFSKCAWGLGVWLRLWWNLLQQMLWMLCSSNRPGLEGAINPMQMPDCRQAQAQMLHPLGKKHMIAFIHFSGHNLQNVQPSGNLTKSLHFLVLCLLRKCLTGCVSCCVSCQSYSIFLLQYVLPSHVIYIFYEAQKILQRMPEI